MNENITRIEVNLKNIKWNLNQISNLIKNTKILAMVKANAYGHGLIEVAKMLTNEKVNSLGVTELNDAIRLRQAGITINILNMGPFNQSQTKEIINYEITQSVFTKTNALYLSNEAQSSKKKAKIYIEIDTGLGRLGIPYKIAVPLVKKIHSMKALSIEGLFSTLSEDKEFDKIQLERFLNIIRSLKKQGISMPINHIASSAAILDFPKAYLDMVRPGIMIYGFFPFPHKKRKIDLKPAMEFKTRVSYIKPLKKGESISYHRKIVLKRDTNVATLPVGYWDGYPKRLEGRADVLIKGERFKILAISMNHSMVDLRNREDIKIGDEVVLIGTQRGEKIDAYEIANILETGPYEIIARINPLIPRIYIR
jgi:alanine racemase